MENDLGDRQPGSRTLRRGSAGDDVRFLQQLLGIDDDGVFGADTERAVQDAQAGAGLESDGIVGADTWRVLLKSTPVADLPPGDGAVGIPPDVESVLVPVESPGGGRIQDKRDPAAADLVTMVGPAGKRVQMHRLAAAAWSALVGTARSDGIDDPLLLPVSGYRSSEHQQALWDRAVEKYGSEQAARRWVAPPGSSAHQSGRAVDCWLGTETGSENVGIQRETACWAWLVDNAEDFGFYPYDKEPWHWEYSPPQA